MDQLHYGQNFEKSWNRKIYHHSIEEHPKISKTAKFGCETVENVENVSLWRLQILYIFVLRTENWYQHRENGINFQCVIQKYTKFANFAGLYFPHFTTFRDQTLQFY